MCSLLDVYIGDDNTEGEDAAETKYGLWWPLAQWAHYCANARNISHPRHSDSPTCPLTGMPQHDTPRWGYSIILGVCRG